MNEGVLFVSVWDGARNMCYESIRLGARAVIGWRGVQFQMHWTARMTGMYDSYLTLPAHISLHPDKQTHTSFPSARHFRLIGLATATAGWGLRHGQIQCVYISMCVSVCVCCCKGTGWSLWHLSPKPNPCPPKPGGWAEPRPPVGPCTPAPTCW